MRILPAAPPSPPPLPWPTAPAARSACPLSILHALNATACAPSAQPPARSRYTLLRSASPPPPHRRRLRSPSLLLCCRALPVPSDQSECAQYDRKRPKYTLGASVALHAAAERWPLATPTTPAGQHLAAAAAKWRSWALPHPRGSLEAACVYCTRPCIRSCSKVLRCRDPNSGP